MYILYIIIYPYRCHYFYDDDNVDDDDGGDDDDDDDEAYVCLLKFKEI